MENVNISTLTHEEKKLLKHLSNGLTKTNAAVELNVSKYTVDKYLRAVFVKFQVRTTVAAVATALRRGEIE